MVSVVETILLGLNVIALSVAVAITVISLRATHRTNSRSHRYAAFGFGLLTVNVALEAVHFAIEDFPAPLAHSLEAVEMILFLVGFSALYLSLR